MFVVHQILEVTNEIMRLIIAPAIIRRMAQQSYFK